MRENQFHLSIEFQFIASDGRNLKNCADNCLVLLQWGRTCTAFPSADHYWGGLRHGVRTEENVGAPSFEDPVGTFTSKCSSTINQSINQSNNHQTIHQLADLINLLHKKFPKRSKGLKENFPHFFQTGNKVVLPS